MYQSDIPMGSGEDLGTVLVVTSVVVTVVVVVVVTVIVVFGVSEKIDISVASVVGSAGDTVNWLQSISSVFVLL